MKNIEREIKILTHIKEIEKALDTLGVASKNEVQKVLSARIGNESHKLKVKKPTKGKTEYLFCKKYSVKTPKKVTNDNFSNKVETEIILKKKDFEAAENLFRVMFENHKMMEYSIKKKRYIAYMGYNIDVCQVVKYEGKSNYYVDKFIEVEEVNGQEKDRITLDQLITFLIPKETNIRTITCGMRNLNKYHKKISTISPTNKK